MITTTQRWHYSWDQLSPLLKAENSVWWRTDLFTVNSVSLIILKWFIFSAEVCCGHPRPYSSSIPLLRSTAGLSFESWFAILRLLIGHKKRVSLGSVIVRHWPLEFFLLFIKLLENSMLFEIPDGFCVEEDWPLHSYTQLLLVVFELETGSYAGMAVTCLWLLSNNLQPRLYFRIHG